MKSHSEYPALSVFDALHPGETWAAWRAFVKACYGLPMDTGELELFQRHTGREQPREGGYPEAVAVVGVQSGKTSMAATLADHAALSGERGTYALLIGQDYRGAMRALLRYAREPFESIDAFRAEAVRETSDTLCLRNGVSLSAYPCRPAAVRGLRACIVCIDELAHFVTTDGRPVDHEMLRVARGRLATTGGKLIVLSSPYHAAGALYELHRKHFGQNSDVLIWQASAPDMNPALPADYLDRMQADDPEAYRSEVLGEFRAGTSTLLDPEAVADCVADGVRERGPVDGVTYRAFVDVSGGRRDRFTLAIAHRDGDRAVHDVIRAWNPPFDPSAVIAEACDLLKSYRIHRVSGDRYSAEFAVEQFRANGITYEASKLDRSALYLELLPAVNAERVLLLDNERLLRELRMLERRRGQGGRDKVDHPRGEHDDLANAVAGATHELAARMPRQFTIDALQADGTWQRIIGPADASPEPRQPKARQRLIHTADGRIYEETQEGD